jgi:hypothetical protein
MERPTFLDFSQIPSILADGEELYHLPTAIEVTGVMSGKSANSYAYHVGKVMSTFGDFKKVTVPRMCKGSTPVKAHNSDSLAPSGQYVEKRLLYKLIFMSNLTANRQLAEKFMTDVAHAVCEYGYFACEGISVNTTQN